MKQWKDSMWNQIWAGVKTFFKRIKLFDMSDPITVSVFTALVSFFIMGVLLICFSDNNQELLRTLSDNIEEELSSCIEKVSPPNLNDVLYSSLEKVFSSNLEKVRAWVDAFAPTAITVAISILMQAGTLKEKRHSHRWAGAIFVLMGIVAYSVFYAKQRYSCSNQMLYTILFLSLFIVALSIYFLCQYEKHLAKKTSVSG